MSEKQDIGAGEIDEWLAALERSWPAERVEPLEASGWRLRFAPGGGSRVNSVRCADPTPTDLDAAIDAAEQRYKAAGAGAVFQVAAPFEIGGAPIDPPLAERLRARDYQPYDRCDLFEADIGAVLGTLEISEKLRPIRVHAPLATMEKLWRENDVGEARRRIMARADRDRSAGLLVRRGGEAAGAAFASMGDERRLFIHAIVVPERLRRRGVGAALMHAAASFGAELGASRLCAPVLIKNPPSQRLFESVGAKRIGQYVYFRAP